jgi:AraC-like DNA-binding protein
MGGTDKTARSASNQPSPMPPSYDRCAFPAHIIAAIVAELGAEGVATSISLKGTGITPSQLENHTTRVSYRQLDIVGRNALRLSNDPAIALRAGQRMHITAYGMYGYALMSSATPAEVREFSARYNRVVGPFCDLRTAYDGPSVRVTLEPMHWSNPTEDIYRFAVEFALSAHLTLIRDRAGPAFKFSRVLLNYGAPPHSGIYERLFDCQVVFGQRDCGYDYYRDDRPLVLADPRSHAMAREICEQLLGEVNQAGGIAADIRQILIERPGRFATIAAIARNLQMHPRALRRRLEAEGTSYRDLLADVRMRLAIEYLRKTEMINEEIASRLGYSDAANFRHAFTRWTGKSPSEFRSSGGA